MSNELISGKVEGIEEAIAALASIPDKLQRKVMRKAMTRATKPTVAAVRSHVPKQSGTLRKSIGRKIKTYTETGTIVAVIGAREGFGADVIRDGHVVFEDPSKIAHLIEFGVRPHTVKKGDKLARTSAMAKAADARRDANIARWTKAMATSVTDSDRNRLSQKIKKSRRAAATSKIQIQTAGAWVHPGFAAHPFMRPGYDETKTQVEETFAAECETGLAAELKKG